VPPARSWWALGTAVVSVAMLAVAFVTGHWWSLWHPVVQPTFKRLTFDEGFVFAARFAPDGRQIVYSANWRGQPSRVFVTSLDGPQSRALADNADLLGISSR